MPWQNHLRGQGPQNVFLYTDEGVVPAVDGLDFTLEQGRRCSQSSANPAAENRVTSLSILGSFQSRREKSSPEKILYNGEDLLKKTEREMRTIRGNDISMIFQEPMTILNPVFTVRHGRLCESSQVSPGHGEKEGARSRVEMLTLRAASLTPERRSSTNIRTSSPAACASAS